MISVIVPAYNPPQAAIDRQMELWNHYPRDILRAIELVFIDDASTEPLWPKFHPAVQFTHARIDIDIKWNQTGARNLGAVLAKGDHLLFCDVDHGFPTGSIIDLLRLRNKQELAIYGFKRSKLTNGASRPFRPAVTVVMMPRKLFWASGGFNEDLVGGYGEDALFKEQIKPFFRPTGINCVFSDEWANQALDRTVDPKIKALCAKKIKELKSGTYHNDPILRFKWHLVE